MSSFHLRFVGAGEQAGTANECGVCGEVTNGRVLRCQQAGFTLDSNRCDLHRNRDHPLNGARTAFWDDATGSIEPGKYADLVVLSQDIMSVPEDTIPQTRVLATLLGGKPVHDTGIFS